MAREFSTTTTLLPHQRPAVAKLLPSRVGAMFMDPGTGKSRVLLELARLRQDKWDRLFWFTPCSLRDNVREQILIHTDLSPTDIKVWNGGKLIPAELAKIRFHIIGIESMSASDRTVLAYNAVRTTKSYVAVDESSYIKGWRSRRTQRIVNMSAKTRYRDVLTGTPFTQGAVDLYSQMFFLSPQILGYRSFWSFAANHLEYEERKDAFGRRFRTGRILRSHNEEYLAARIAPYTYQVRKDECLDLPEKLYETRYCSLTETQKEYYEEAKWEILSLDYDDWSSIKIFHLFTSLQTIVCGWWKRPNGDVVEMPHNRLDLLLGTVEDIPETEKVIILAKYRPAVRQICEALGKAYGVDQVAPYHGGLPQKELPQQLDRWRSSARFLVATQTIGGYGLTLNEAAYSIFYADGFKYSERVQSEDRTHRIGQTRRPVYISLCSSSGIDRRIAWAIESKGNALAEFQRQIDIFKQQGLRKNAEDLVRSL